ncbi:hypothetical protein JCM8097_001412 [Rhodosporidiobolus ruineniae]
MTTLPPAATANVEVEQSEPPEGEQEHHADKGPATTALAALSLHETASLNVLPLPPEIILDILSSPTLRPRNLAVVAVTCHTLLPLAREVLYRAVDLFFDRITVRVDYQSVSLRYCDPLGRRGAFTTLTGHPHLRHFVREVVVSFEESDIGRAPPNFHRRPEINFQAQVSELFSGLDRLEKIVWLSETDSRNETLVFRQSWLLTVTSLDVPVFFPWIAYSLPSLTTLRTKAQLDEGVDTSIPSPARLQHLVVHHQAFGDKPIEFLNWVTSNSFSTLTSLSIPCDFYLLGFPPSPHQNPLDPARLFRPTISHLTALHILVLSAPSARQNLVSIGPPALPAWPPSLRKLAIYTLPPARRSRSVDHVPLPWLYDRAAGRTFPSTLYRLVLDRRVVPLDELVRLVRKGEELPQLRELDVGQARADWVVGRDGDVGGKGLESLREACEERGIRLIV